MFYLYIARKKKPWIREVAREAHHEACGDVEHQHGSDGALARDRPAFPLIRHDRRQELEYEDELGGNEVGEVRRPLSATFGGVGFSSFLRPPLEWSF